MIWFVPLPFTRLLVTSIVSATELSDDLYITIFPVSTSTASEKLRTIWLPTATAVALSAGLLLVNDGFVKSPVVKEREVVSLIPA